VTVTVRLTNRDDVAREYEVVVRFGEGVTDRFAGVLPADTDEVVEMIATGRPTNATDTAEFSVRTAAGRRGRTWDPTECPALLVEAFVADGRPEFETTCRGE
jgi:hypothetical protein